MRTASFSFVCLIGTLLTHGGSAQVIDVFVATRFGEVDPHYATSFAEHAISAAMHRGLTGYDAEGRLIPDLAESWSVDRGGTKYTFTLKPDQVWSDGRPLTAGDFVAGLERSLTSGRASPFASQLHVISGAFPASGEEAKSLGVYAPDPNTVEITLNRPDALLPHTLARPVAAPAPKHNPEGLADGAVVSGAYTLSEMFSEATVLTHRSSGQRLRIRPAASVADAWERSAEAAAFVTTAFPIVTVPRVGARGSDVKTGGGQDLYAYVVNTRRAPLNTLEARHALAMAINRAEVLAAAGLRTAVSAVEFVPPSAKTYQTSYRTPYASLSEEEREAVAEALLAEAGYGPENRFTVRLRIPLGDIHGEVATSVVRMWQRSGIQTDIIAAPLPEHWSAVEAGDFDVAFAAWPGPKDTPRTFLEPLSVFGGPWNYAAYTFEGLGERLSKAAEADRPDVRAQFYREAEKALIEDQTLFALFYYQPLALVSGSVSGWQVNSAGVHPLESLVLRTEASRPLILRPELPRAIPSIEGES